MVRRDAAQRRRFFLSSSSLLLEELDEDELEERDSEREDDSELFDWIVVLRRLVSVRPRSSSRSRALGVAYERVAGVGVAVRRRLLCVSVRGVTSRGAAVRWRAAS